MITRASVRRVSTTHDGYDHGVFEVDVSVLLTAEGPADALARVEALLNAPNTKED